VINYIGMDRPLPAIEFIPNTPSATHVRGQELMPGEPLLLRDLNARETVGVIRITLSMGILVIIFFIAVFGVLGAIADAVGSVFGLHQNYSDVVGTH
jgi:hypothetical protein